MPNDDQGIEGGVPAKVRQSRKNPPQYVCKLLALFAPDNPIPRVFMEQLRNDGCRDHYFAEQLSKEIDLIYQD